MCRKIYILTMIYDTQEPIINFSDILFVYKFRDKEVKHHKVNDHTLVYVYSGELEVIFQNHKTIVGADECIFLSRNNRVTFSACPAKGVEFKGTFLTLSRQFLIRYYHEMDKTLLPSCNIKRMPNVYKLPMNLPVNSLFKALTSFFMAWQNPTLQYMELKECEAVEGLMDINIRFCANLFDFLSPWKIDIMEFMNQNYTEELSLSEMALFTGRSLATFKRDFKQITTLSPQRWVTQKRLETAYQWINEGKKISDFYFLLGFKSLSHFSTAFKRQYGISPNELLNKLT